MSKRILLSTILSVLFFWITSHAQSPEYKILTGTLEGIKPSAISSGATINFANTDKVYSQASLLKEHNRSAKLYFKLDLGNDYVKKSGSWNFKVELNLNYIISGNTVAKTLVIDNHTPEVLKFVDLTQLYQNIQPTAAPAININILSIDVHDGSTNELPISGFVKNYVDSNLRLTAQFIRNYDVDVRLQTGLMSAAPVISTVTKNNRLVTFNWQANHVDAYPSYELQILKLENTSPENRVKADQIKTIVNWEKALKIETQSPATTFALNVSEGTGFYIWRVRPIGTYYNGGIGNSENYGIWSHSYQDGDIASLDKGQLTQHPGIKPYAFYFQDPDEKINWIYNRVFTEGDFYDKGNPTGVKSSESISYADGLLRTRQTQKYNSSEDISIISQNVPDFLGRPTLNTIPVPVNSGLKGYKKKFARTAQDSLYRAEHFDTDTTYLNPMTIQDNGSSYFKYYSDSTTHASGINNVNVPDAEGFAFQRTLLSNDGKNRVIEESGVGKRHSIGQQSAGRGRTTRTMYSTPSDDELIRIFGEEAPLAESVLKTYTIDQNNAVSISYTSKEGHVIATSLKSDTTDNLSGLGNAVDSFIVKNSITEKNKNGGKILGSKRIMLGEDTTKIKLSYFYNKNDVGSSCLAGSASIKLRFYIIDLERNHTFISDADSVAGITDFDAAPSFVFPAGWRFVNADMLSTPAKIAPFGAANEYIKLPRGTYLFVKELYSGNKSGYADSIAAAAYNSTKPVIEAITAKMQNVNSPILYKEFTAFIDTLKTKMDSYYHNTGITSNDLLEFLKIDSLVPDGYIFPDEGAFNISAVTASEADPSENSIEIQSDCCGSMKVQLPKLNVCIPCDGHPGEIYQTLPSNLNDMINTNNLSPADSIIPYGINDFRYHHAWSSLNDSLKRNAIDRIVERDFIVLLKEKMAEADYSIDDLWKIAPGFSFNSLKFMVSNMLISQYYTGKAIQDSTGQWRKIVMGSLGNYIMDSVITEMNHPFNYDCKELFESWEGAISLQGTIETESTGDLVTAYNANEGNGAAQNEADDEENYDDLNRRQKKKLKKKLSESLTEFSSTKDGQMSKEKMDSKTSTISNFFLIAKPQYAAIIDGDLLPDYIVSANKIFPDEYIKSYAYLGPISGQGYGFDYPVTIGSPPHTNNSAHVPLLFGINNNHIELETDSCRGAEYPKLYYPYILKPEWMFKYFVYNKFTNGQQHDFITDSSTIIPHQVDMDIVLHYNESHSYLSGAIQHATDPDSVCGKTPKSTYFDGFVNKDFSYHHNNWDMNDRFQFYEAIQGCASCYEKKGLEKDSSAYIMIGAMPDLPTCPTKAELVAQAREELNTRITACDGLRPMIVQALIDEFSSSCYEIVECKVSADPGIVSMNEIDFVASRIINYAKDQITAIKNKFLVLDTTLSIPACSSPDSTFTTYGDSLCSLPSCYQINCYDIAFVNNNTVERIKSVKMGIKYFTDCDEKILHMIAEGHFLPYIPPLAGCTKPPKQWRHGSCLPESAPCGTNHPVNTYAEKTTCSPSNYKRYTQTYKITANN